MVAGLLVLIFLVVAFGAAERSEARKKKQDVRLGIFDQAYLSANPDTRAFWLDRTVEAGAQRVSVTAEWRSIAPEAPANPTDPADPTYRFSVIDDAVRDAAARGIEVFLTVTRAPDWAEGPDRDPGAEHGAWRPQPGLLAKFATALATRYSGTYPDPANPGAPLPRVADWGIWAEPNLGTNLYPQAVSGNGGVRAVGAEHFRAMVNAASRAIKAVDPSNKVIANGTAPFGDQPFKPGVFRTPPLEFWRAFFCLERVKRLQPTKRCPGGRPRIDAFAHNPLAGLAHFNNVFSNYGPHDTAIWPTDILVPDMYKLALILRAARKYKLVKPVQGTELWVTELAWETDPPDPQWGVSLQTQAAHITESLRLLSKQGVSEVYWVQIGDQPYDPEFSGPAYLSGLQSGLFFEDGTPKPGLAAFRAGS